jgi:hypothetical protein
MPALVRGGRKLDMFFAPRFSAYRMLTLGVAGTLIATATLVAVGPILHG